MEKDNGGWEIKEIRKITVAIILSLLILISRVGYDVSAQGYDNVENLL